MPSRLRSRPEKACNLPWVMMVMMVMRVVMVVMVVIVVMMARMVMMMTAGSFKYQVVQEEE
jgi:hypothetical protein